MGIRVIGVATALVAIAVLFASVVLVVAAIQDYQENRGASFIERAASMVGIGEDIIEEEFTESLEARVEEIEDELDELKTRLDELPEIPRLQTFTELPFQEFEFGRLDIPFEDFEFGDLYDGDEWIEELVERGVMTEDDADQIRSWFEDLPDTFDDEFPFPDFSDNREFEFDSDDGRFRFRWYWNDSDDDGFFQFFPEDDKDGRNGI